MVGLRVVKQADRAGTNVPIVDLVPVCGYKSVLAKHLHPQQGYVIRPSDLHTELIEARINGQ